MKYPTSFRISSATREKLDKLTAVYGTQAEVLAVAIDRLYEDNARHTVQPGEAVNEECSMAKFYIDDRMENEISLNAATVAAFKNHPVAVEFDDDTTEWMDRDDFILAFYPMPVKRNEAWERLMQ